MKPVVDGLRKQYAGKVEFVLINAEKADDAQQELMQQYRITAVPTFVFVGSNGVMVSRLLGERTVDEMRKALDELK